MELRKIQCKLRNGAGMSRETLILPKSVLVIDDDLNLRRSLELILKHAGYLVTVVGRACEAIERLEAGKYDMLILDIVTIDNRLTLLPIVQRLYPHIPILVFTSKWSPETAVEIEHFGVKAYLINPGTPKSLLECVDTIIKESPDHS
jgi:DNA-binding NtrC family response regulator